MTDIYGPIRTAIARIDEQIRGLQAQADALKSEVATLLDKRQALASVLGPDARPKRRCGPPVASSERATIIAEVRRSVEQGESWASVGARLGRCESTLRRCFREAGEPMPVSQHRLIVNRRRRAELARVIARERAAGASAVELAHRYGIDPSTVLAWAKWAESCDGGKADEHEAEGEAEGAPAAPPLATAEPLGRDALRMRIAEMHAAGMGTAEIASTLGLCSASVRGHLGVIARSVDRLRAQAAEQKKTPPAAPPADPPADPRVDPPVRLSAKDVRFFRNGKEFSAASGFSADGRVRGDMTQPQPLLQRTRSPRPAAADSPSAPLEFEMHPISIVELREAERTGRPRSVAAARMALEHLGVVDPAQAIHAAAQGLPPGKVMAAVLRLYDAALRRARESCGSLGVVR